MIFDPLIVEAHLFIHGLTTVIANGGIPQAEQHAINNMKYHSGQHARVE